MTEPEVGGLELREKVDGVFPENFIKFSWILMTKPNIVNSRLTGCEIISCNRVVGQESTGITGPPAEDNEETHLVRRLIPKDFDRYDSVIEKCTLSQRELRISQTPSPIEPSETESVREPVMELISYALRLEDTSLSLWTSESSKYTEEMLFPRFVKWMRQKAVDDQKQLQQDSLSLVDIETYSRTYSDLKKRYGKALVDVWTEKTDPLKFVYEDIAIASYLISLWDPRMEGRKESYVDLGCGNALLVYILNSEGHRGIGVDVRRRDIWSKFPADIQKCLREEPVTDSSRFEANWFIGNHSDELTPWIPVLAQLSSAQSKVFLLPCCPFNLYGKYQRSSPVLSQYQSYLLHLKESFLPRCGFTVKTDKLRIPSTKRICFILEQRGDDHERLKNEIGIMIKEESKVFVPREKEIKVRNCSQLNKDLVNGIVNRIAAELLSRWSATSDENAFNRGGTMQLKDAIRLVKADECIALKDQCGGLQTLLKNNYHVFQVMQGQVTLRMPAKQLNDGKLTKKQKFQKRPCWFKANHPQGCPLSDGDCRFEHLSDGDSNKQS